MDQRRQLNNMLWMATHQTQNSKVVPACFGWSCSYSVPIEYGLDKRMQYIIALESKAENKDPK